MFIILQALFESTGFTHWGRHLWTAGNFPLLINYIPKLLKLIRIVQVQFLILCKKWGMPNIDIFMRICLFDLWESLFCFPNPLLNSVADRQIELKSFKPILEFALWGVVLLGKKSKSFYLSLCPYKKPSLN